MYGITDTGFVIKPFEVIIEEVRAFFRSRYGETVDLTTESDLGQAAFLVAQLSASHWELQQDAYNAHDVNSAEDYSLDILCALNGVYRRLQQPSKAIVLAAGDPTTTLPIGRTVSDSLRNTFESVAAVTLAAATNRASSHTYVAGDIVTYALKILYCTTGGVSASSGPAWDTIPAVGSSYTDGTAVFKVVGSGSAYALLDVTNQVDGFTPVLAGQITTIDTPITGWLSAYNIEDTYYPGASRETNAELKSRRDSELHVGQGTAATIKQKVLKVAGVTKCYVVENDTDIISAAGLPPHSVEVFAAGGTDLGIAEEIFFNAKAAGIATYGTESVTVTDEDEVSHIVHFSRIAESLTDIYVAVTLTVDSSFDAVAGPEAVKLSLISYGDGSYRPGSSVIASQLDRQVWIAGVVDAQCTIGLSAGSLSRTTITTDLSHIPDLDSTRIAITIV